MKVRYSGESDPDGLKNGNAYEVIAVEKSWYRIVDESGEECLYPPDVFDPVENPKSSNTKTSRKQDRF